MSVANLGKILLHTVSVALSVVVLAAVGHLNLVSVGVVALVAAVAMTCLNVAARHHVVVRASGAIPTDADADTRQAVAALSGQLGLRGVRVVSVWDRNRVLDASADPMARVVQVDDEFERLPVGQRHGVLAHEVAHLASPGLLAWTLLSQWWNVAKTLFALWAAVVAVADARWLAVLLAAAAWFASGLWTELARMWVSRSYEYQADLMAAELGHAQGLASALVWNFPGTHPLEWLTTHPTTEHRVARLVANR